MHGPMNIKNVFFDVWKDHETVFNSKQSKKTVDCLPWKLNNPWSFQTSGTTHPVTQHHIPENLNHQQHCHENLKILHQAEEAITAVDAIVETGDRHSRKYRQMHCIVIQSSYN